MHNVSDLRSTIIPKSDQLNSEQLLGGPITITVTDVTIGSAEQPITVHYQGEDGRPYKPCKTMRKVLLLAWGPDGNEWAGKSMTLYCDPNVKFGGEEVGGIRISAMSHLEKRIQASLTATRGKKALHTVEKLASAPAVDYDAIAQAATVEVLKDLFGKAYKSTKDAAVRTRLKATYDARLAELTRPAKSLEQFTEAIDAALDATEAGMVLDEARGVLSAEDFALLEPLPQGSLDRGLAHPS